MTEDRGVAEIEEREVGDPLGEQLVARKLKERAPRSARTEKERAFSFETLGLQAAALGGIPHEGDRQHGGKDEDHGKKRRKEQASCRF